MRFPGVARVAAALRDISTNVEGECDVRLQVYPNGDWGVRFGDASYDQDHRGYWGASSVPGNGRRFSSADVARDLLDQAKEQHAQDDSQ